MKNAKRNHTSMAAAALIDFRPPRIAMTLLATALLAQLAWPVTLHPGAPLAGSIVALAGFILMIRAWWLFRVADTAICPNATATTLITQDVYRLSRNPMYLGILMMLGGLALAIGALALHAATVTFFVFMDRVFCPYEERKSLQEFGDRYAAYRDQVRRWV